MVWSALRSVTRIEPRCRWSEDRSAGPQVLAPRSSSFLRSHRAALLRDLEPELLLCEKVAVLIAAGYKRTEVARMLVTETPAALRAAELRIKQATQRLDAGDDD